MELRAGPCEATDQPHRSSRAAWPQGIRIVLPSEAGEEIEDGDTTGRSRAWPIGYPEDRRRGEPDEKEALP